MSLKHAILVLLETEPGSGYDLLKQFNSSVGYFWNAKHQQIYQQLKVLSEQELITFAIEKQENRPDKKVYKITNNGINELKTWISCPVKPNKVNDALLVKLYGGHLTNKENLITELQQHLDSHLKTQTYLKQVEQTFLNLPSDKKKKYQLPYLTLRRGILGEEAWIMWANESIEAIKK